MSATDPILRLESVSKHFGGLRVIEDLTLAVRRGVRTALIGPNGAGKTTVFNLITGVFPVDAGRILLDGADITGTPSRLRIGHGIAAIRSTALMNTLAERKIPLEICPTSNVCTNALNIQLNSAKSDLTHHPLSKFFRHGIPVTLSTDDPAMISNDGMPVSRTSISTTRSERRPSRSCSRMRSRVRIMSRTGMPSVMQTTTSSPASTASSMAAAAKGGGA